MNSNPIFIFSAPRSGSSLLRNLFNKHPDVFISFETTYLYMRKNVAQRREFKSWYKFYRYSLPFKWQLFSPAEISKLDRLVEAGVTDFQFWTEMLRLQANKRQKTVYGDKTPFHSSFVPEISQSIPEAKLIAITRDPLEVVASMYKLPWGAGSLLLNALHCRHNLSGLIRNANQLKFVKLEELAKNSNKTMTDLCRYCELRPWNESFLDNEDETTPQFSWHRKTQTPASMSKISKADLELPWVFAFLIRQILRLPSEKLGYNGYKYIKVVTGIWTHLRFLIKEIVGASYTFLQLIFTYFIFWLGIRLPLAIQIWLYNNLNLYSQIRINADESAHNLTTPSN